MCGPATLIQWFYNLHIVDRQGSVGKKFLVQLEVSYFKCMPTINVTVSAPVFQKFPLVVASSFHDPKNNTLTHTCTHLHTHVHTPSHTHTHTHVNTHTHEHTHAVHTCKYTYAHTHTHTHTHTCTHIHAYTHAHPCTHPHK